MGLTLAEATVAVHADVSKVGTEAESGVRKQSGHFGGIGAVMGGILGAGVVQAGVDGVKKVFSAGLEEAKETSGVQAQLTSGIKSTGDAAKVSIKSLNQQAAAISEVSGQSKNSISSAQSLLLTFTNIKNSGPDKIFDQTTQAAANMAAKMGGDAASKAILLGKAINDPIKGMTTLQRVGVSFTSTQKAVTTALVNGGDANASVALGLVDSTKTWNNVLKANHGNIQKTIDQVTKGLTPAQQKLYKHYAEGGHTIEAQKNILGELNKEFGGSAKAAGSSLPGALAKLKNAFSESAGGVVTGLLPAIMQILPVVTKIIKTVIPILGTLIPPVLSIVKAILPLVQMVLPLLAGLLKPIIGLFGSLLKPIIALVTPLLKPLVQLLSAVLVPVLKILTPELKILGIIFDIVGKVLGVVIGWIAQGITWFTKLISSATGGLKIGDVFKIIGAVISLEIKGITTVVKNVVGFFATAFASIGRIVHNVGDAFSSVFTGISGFIKSAFVNAVGFVRNGINGVIGLVNLAITALDKLRVKVPAWVPGIGGQNFGLSIPKIPLLANGTNSAPDMFIAGDRGPELITGARGATVRPYSATMDMLNTSSKAQKVYHFAAGAIVLDAKNVRDFTSIVDMLDALPQIARK